MEGWWDAPHLTELHIVSLKWWFMFKVIMKTRRWWEREGREGPREPRPTSDHDSPVDHHEEDLDNHHQHHQDDMDHGNENFCDQAIPDDHNDDNDSQPQWPQGQHDHDPTNLTTTKLLPRRSCSQWIKTFGHDPVRVIAFTLITKTRKMRIEAFGNGWKNENLMVILN